MKPAPDAVPQAGPLPPAILLMGPTAAGKTGIALELAERYPMDIISVDSAQVYRGLDIGTAKPPAEIQARFPHRLIDIREPEQAYSAAEFRSDALTAMAAISAAGRVPLLVGGTMLYFRALERGLSQLPAADPEVRAWLAERAEREGWDALHAELAQLDPVAAARIHPNDPQRIQRALEVRALTGRPLSAQQTGAGERLPYQLLKLVICPTERQELHRRIALRFGQMLEQGFLAEVEALRARPGLHAGLPSMRAVGYRQAWTFLAGDCGAEDMRERALAATRQLAKRQLTWLRSEKATLWYDADRDWRSGGALKSIDAVLEVAGRRSHS